MTLREILEVEKKGEGAGKAADLKSILRMQHLQNLALWAGGGEASMTSFAAFLGNHLATCGEATGVPLDPLLFPCQRCESILQPGFNCTVRVETNGAKVRRRRNKAYIPTKNIVIYTCHFCSHRNVKRGTPKRHMKEIFASKLKPVSELESTSTDHKHVSLESAIKGSKEIDKKMVGTVLSQQTPVSKSNLNSSVMHPEPREEATDENSPTTPKTLLSGRKRKRKKNGSVTKEPVANENKVVNPNAERAIDKSSRKRRKSWLTLKKITENRESKITNLTLPFFK